MALGPPLSLWHSDERVREVVVVVERFLVGARQVWWPGTQPFLAMLPLASPLVHTMAAMRSLFIRSLTLLWRMIGLERSFRKAETPLERPFGHGRAGGGMAGDRHQIAAMREFRLPPLNTSPRPAAGDCCFADRELERVPTTACS